MYAAPSSTDAAAGDVRQVGGLAAKAHFVVEMKFDLGGLRPGSLTCTVNVPPSAAAQC